MNVQTYLANKNLRLEASSKAAGRRICYKCRLALAVCDCAALQPFDPGIQFVILIHPEEVRRRIATGRLSHFLLKNSLLLEGEHFGSDPCVQGLIDDPQNISVVLYPGHGSLNLTEMETSSKTKLFPKEKRLTAFVMDGTWRTAKKMLRLSPNLSALPRVSFQTPRPSGFQIRKQPAPECFSTIEAIHHLIELLAEPAQFDITCRRHDHLLEMFDRMVQRQIDYQRRFSAARAVTRSAHEIIQLR